MTINTKLIFFDLDGTLIDGYEYIYQHLWEYFGVDTTETRKVLKQYLNKEVTYEEWVMNDVRLLQEAGATKPKILEAIKSLRPMKNAVAVLRALRERGYKIFVVSGGIDLVIEAVFGLNNNLFDDEFINKYEFDESGNLIGATPTKYDMEHKATCLKDVSTRYGLAPKDCIFIGDNVNDVDAALLAGTSIAFNSKSEQLVEAATHHVKSSDLNDILQYIVN